MVLFFVQRHLRKWATSQRSNNRFVMFVGRKKELEYLNDTYSKQQSNIIVLYGHKGVGKTSLMFCFAKDKEYKYYNARNAAEKEQLILWNNEAGLSLSDEELSFSNILKSYSYESDGKRILIIDEFHNLIKNSDNFFPELLRFVKEADQEYLVVLVSSSICFVENTFVNKVGLLAQGISGFVKVPWLSYFDFIKYIKQYDKQSAMELYSIFGGCPKYWKYIDTTKSVKDNICRLLVDKDGILFNEGLNIISEELREIGVYSTILDCLASGMNKLNELHSYTGFSRAKISVYIKNLMELEIVEKVFSFDNASIMNSKKGVYRISNNLLKFYFRFIYKGLSKINMMSPSDYYDQYIEREIDLFHQDNFKLICREYVELMNQRGMLPLDSVKSGEWVGKSGCIDYILQSEDWDNLLVFCDWKKEGFSYEDYVRRLNVISESRLSADYILIFARGEFDQELIDESNASDNVSLVGFDSL